MEKKLIHINQKLGGRLVNPSNLMFDVEQAKQIKNNPFKRNAHIVRGVAVGHPFSDANKRTTTIFITKDFQKQGYLVDEETVVKGIKNVAREGINHIPDIERRLRKWYIKK